MTSNISPTDMQLNNIRTKSFTSELDFVYKCNMIDYIPMQLAYKQYDSTICVNNPHIISFNQYLLNSNFY